MDWLLDNIQFVIAFAAAFAWWLNKRRERAQLEREAQEQLSEPSTQQFEIDDAERARRIQEEIRRKIAERRTLPPVARPVVVQEWSQPPPLEPPMQAERGYDVDAEFREQQRQLQEKLRLVEETRKRAAEIRARVPESSGMPVATARHEPVSGLHASLKNVSEIRRAIVLREILGAPKGLQP